MGILCTVPAGNCKYVVVSLRDRLTKKWKSQADLALPGWCKSGHEDTRVGLPGLGLFYSMRNNWSKHDLSCRRVYMFLWNVIHRLHDRNVLCYFNFLGEFYSCCIQAVFWLDVEKGLRLNLCVYSMPQCRGADFWVYEYIDNAMLRFACVIAPDEDHKARWITSGLGGEFDFAIWYVNISFSVLRVTASRY